VGKSSLFNALLQRERAIVTPQPGTTRDFLEEVVNLEGLPFLLVDTAGMRADDLSLEPAERHGVERTRDWIERADLLLVLLDASQALSDEDRLLLQEIRGRKGILVMNKVDLPVRLSRGEALEAVPGLPCVQVSALSGEGLEELKGIMVEAVGREGLDTTEGLVITQLRHRQALDKAERALAEARKALAQGLSWEFVCLDLRESLEALGEITGETATADILEQIFSRFCIGK
jgi:tRNA modification GTPase